ncbi:MAG: ATP-binding protein [Planctomycetes bacterium]|nr:ATP-binding protein [Planctomycetota bacterium]
MRGVSETLAGRVAYVDMSGFDIADTRPSSFRTLWTRGGFPRSFLARSEAASFEWREDFVRSFLEREIPQLGFSIPAATLRRFWTMIAHFHGQVWNAAEFARSLGEREGWFYRTHAGAELDLLIVRGGKRYGFEIKLTDGPSMTKSMHVAHEDLRLERLFVVYPGPKSWPMGERTEAVSILDLPAKLEGLK